MISPLVRMLNQRLDCLLVKVCLTALGRSITTLWGDSGVYILFLPSHPYILPCIISFFL